MITLNPKTRLIPALLAGLAMLSGCTNQNIGTATGAALGGYLGSHVGKGTGQLAATAAGALAGTVIGGSIGARMEELDYRRTNRALESSRTGIASSWQNPDTGYNYSVTPTQTYQTNNGPCREYRTDATINGQYQTVYGTACRQQDGRWISTH